MREYEIDGRRTTSLNAFFAEVSRVLLPGVSWGRNLDAFDDVLYGGLEHLTRATSSGGETRPKRGRHWATPKPSDSWNSDLPTAILLPVSRWSGN
jgi:hypothetical protein